MNHLFLITLSAFNTQLGSWKYSVPHPIVTEFLDEDEMTELSIANFPNEQGFTSHKFNGVQLQDSTTDELIARYQQGRPQS